MSTGEERIAGVSLAQVAVINAALAEGVPLKDALAHEGVAPDAWVNAQRAWQERLDEDVADEGLLFEEYDAQLVAARGRFARRVPPLDEEISDWIHFLRALGARADPITFLASKELVPEDIGHLHRVWAARFEAEPALRGRAVAALQEPARDVHVPKPPPRGALPRRPDAPSIAPPLSEAPPPVPSEPPTPFVFGVLEAIPPQPHVFAAWAPKPQDAPPPLEVNHVSAWNAPPPVVPAPPPSSPSIATQTLVLSDRAESKATSQTVELNVTSFPAYKERPTPKPPGTDAPSESHPRPATGTPAITQAAPVPQEMSLEQYAAMCAELLLGRAAKIYAKYGVEDPGVREGIQREWSRRLQADAELYDRWQNHYLATLEKLGVRGT